MTEGFERTPDRTRDECGAEKVPLPPGVLERRYGGQAVRGSDTQVYHCLASTVLGEPCKNLTRWFFIPRNSHLCLSHIRQRLSTVPPGPAAASTSAIP